MPRNGLPRSMWRTVGAGGVFAPRGATAAADVADDRAGEVFRPQGGDGVAERADAGEDDLVGLVDLLGLRDDVGAGADVLERLLHRAEVGHAVIDDRDGH